MKTLHLFAGAGGGLLADLILGHEPIGAVEWDPYCCEILRERAKDGWFKSLAVHEGDIREFDASEYAGRVGCVAGGFPCQDISAAGKGRGLDGERSGLWSEFARVLGDVRPRFAFIENSPMLTARGLDRVLCDLAAMGFDAEWAVISAADAGAVHRRERIWILANADGGVCNGRADEPQRKAQRGVAAGRSREDVAYTNLQRCQEQRLGVTDGAQLGGAELRGEDVADSDSFDDDDGGFGAGEARGQQAGRETAVQERAARRIAFTGLGRVADGLAPSMDSPSWWSQEPEDTPRVAQGVPDRVARLKALGNGQVPAQAALAWRILSRGIANA